ncbi:cytochrome d ubiquinol oxidase subunit II [Thalassoglobus sp. JC818]|uniref:cytochrome d ubiquinol oxidase subunit II n=1 Tax=Thalassoglobus sp. JC818 TaxID=3232136 RepID=UPI00345880C2
MDWNLLWFVILGILLTGYAILDGFDLGVGMLSPLGKTDKEKRIILNSIGPIWDGNEVWLVTFGGAMFAAFPEAYATVFSGYYEGFMVILAALIFRAVSIEFRSKLQIATWRGIWDKVFFVSSLTASFVFGVAVGGAMTGVPLDGRGIFRGSVSDQIDWYPVLTGFLTIAMFLMHGAIYLTLKTGGELRQRARRWIWIGYFAFLALYLALTVATLTTIPKALHNFHEFPFAYAVVILNVLAIMNISRTVKMEAFGQAFLSSACTIAALVFLFGVSLFPNLVASDPHPENSLTIYNAASSTATLKLMTLIAVIGMPFVLGYTGAVYWTFRGRVELDKHSY